MDLWFKGGMSNAPSEAPSLTSVRVVDPVTRKGVYLLPGWRQAVSRSKGKTFYFSAVTKETRWLLAGITDELRAPEDLTPEEEAALRTTGEGGAKAGERVKRRGAQC